MQVLSRKFTVALIATFLFSFILTIASYTQATEQHLPFSTLLLTFVVLSAPMFLIVGVIASFVFEKFIRSPKIKWFSYIVVGAVFIIPYAIYFFRGADLLLYSLIGAAGAVLYCAVQAIFNKYIFKEAII
ncbi:hypothetical protein ACTHOQ_10215 [Solibacillus silvestris]|uniref:hypothetical protein n=1 Tax=Solibacillus silvestris TaxID=76853 RepID=UPI003F80DE0D